MRVIDDRGRLFGRINLIDFALLVFVVALVPLAYGAYLLLRTPPPRIVAVTPNSMTFSSGEHRIKIKGEYLRPFMRATVGRNDAKSFLLERRDQAEIVFDELPIGTYDIALFDFAEEIARLPNALTITAPPRPPVQLVGRFVGPAAADAKLAAGAAVTARDQTPIQILSIASAARGERAATLRTPCRGDSGPCAVGGTELRPGASVPLAPAPGSDVAFAVDEVRVDGLWADVHVRLFGLGQALDLVRKGDTDNPPESPRPFAPGVLQGAVVVSVEASQPAPGSVSMNFTQFLPDVVGGFNSNVAASAQLPLTTRPAVLRVPLRRADGAWKYRNEFVRPGSAMTINTGRYLVRGLIERVVVAEPASPNGESQ